MTDSERVLVAYGSKYGSTAEIARVIGDALRVAGLSVDVRAAGKVGSLDAYRAVVLGSAVYAGRWRRDALRLLRRPELGQLEVWLFSSGPVGEEKGDHAEVDRWTRPPKVSHLAEEIGAHEHVGFGGMVAEDAGFMRKRMARGMAPELRDLRDWPRIEAWARSIAAALGAESSTAS
ncbi:MAG: flavodoxin [Actinobacteria bacterium]|nr:flavodoxin [Actinomycetota bacterium]